MRTNAKCLLCLALGGAGSLSGFFALVSGIYPVALAVLALALCAIVLGVRGRKEIRRAAGRMRGRSAAVAGTCLALLGVGFLLLLSAT